MKVVMSDNPVMELYHQKRMGNNITLQKKKEITIKRPLITYIKLSFFCSCTRITLKDTKGVLASMRKLVPRRQSAYPPLKYIMAGNPTTGTKM